MKITTAFGLLTLTLGGPAAAIGTLQVLDAADARLLGLEPIRDGTLLRNTAVGNEDAALDSPAPKGGFRLLALSPSELRGADSSVRLQTTNDARSCAIGATSPFADLAVHLPDGAVLSSMRVFGFDSLANDDMTIGLIRRCTPADAAGAVTTTVLAQITAQTSAGNFSQFQSINANGTIDNQSCSYGIRVRFSSPSGANLCAGPQLRLQKVRLSWTPGDGAGGIH